MLPCCLKNLTQAALRNVNLYVEPPAVRRGQSVTLRCQYTLEGAPLYSVKFYRGQLEFFRYTPGEYPNTKVFHYPGIKVDPGLKAFRPNCNVVSPDCSFEKFKRLCLNETLCLCPPHIHQYPMHYVMESSKESVSNATQVIIRNVSFNLSGNFACEVTADAPLFSTATAYAQMQVVEFPEKRPQLFTELTRYEPGDILRANCSTPPSRPRAELRFTINNMPNVDVSLVGMSILIGKLRNAGRIQANVNAAGNSCAKVATIANASDSLRPNANASINTDANEYC
uniref:Ig-like domain-containing protein n=1 Tax=Glossina austeni TaxID=7395 RepID=A0A1A9V8Q2_GLOAU